MKVFFLLEGEAYIPAVALTLQPGVNDIGDTEAKRLLEISAGAAKIAGATPLCRPVTAREAREFDEAKAAAEKAAAEKAAAEKAAAEAAQAEEPRPAPAAAQPTTQPSTDKRSGKDKE